MNVTAPITSRGVAVLALALTLGSCLALADNGVTEADLRKAVTGEKGFSASQLASMDLNSDGVVDVSDLVQYLATKHGLSSVVGEHVGFLVRDGAGYMRDQAELVGRVPLRLRITSESPLNGEIDNRASVPEDPDGLGHYALYLPEGRHPVAFRTAVGFDLEFEVSFQSSNLTIAPDKTLTRRIVFRGDFQDADRIVFAGEYTEHIDGIEDQRGSNIPITLTGKFLLVFSSSD